MLAPLFLLASTLSAAELYFPSTDANWQHIAPAKAGWSKAALDDLMTFAKSRRSSAVVILLNGKILAEQQWGRATANATAQYRSEQSADGQIIEDIASCQKSITAILFSIAQQKGLLRIDDPVAKHLGKGWSKATPEQEQKILFHHLLTMTSGLNDSLEFEAAPGTKWLYNTTAYQQTIKAIAKAAGKSENDLTKEWLTSRIGMTHSNWRSRPAMPGLIGFNSTAYDMARVGLLIQNNGEWNGQPIIPDKVYLKAMLSPSQSLNPNYGYLWWLGSRWPEAPQGTVAALGALGRKIYVVPSLGLVATRTGNNADLKGEPSFDREFFKLLMKAAPTK